MFMLAVVLGTVAITGANSAAVLIGREQCSPRHSVAFGAGLAGLVTLPLLFLSLAAWIFPFSLHGGREGQLALVIVFSLTVLASTLAGCTAAWQLARQNRPRA